jgi:hypothetical protein
MTATTRPRDVREPVGRERADRDHQRNDDDDDDDDKEETHVDALRSLP